MSEVVQPTVVLPEPDTKPCKVCAEPIKRAARICNHCSSYQDWRGHLGMGQNVLALLVALISVGTVFVPVLSDYLTPKNSDFAFSLQSTEPHQISILASNRGSRPGTVTGAGLFWVPDSGVEEGLKAEIIPNVHLLGPGQSVLITFVFMGKPPATISQARRFELMVRYTNFDGEDEAMVLPPFEGADATRVIRVFE
jgi:hypothetical protein